MKSEWFDKILETGKEITITIKLQDVYDELYEICDREHSSCNRTCPVYDLACHEGEYDESMANECLYYKNGKAMFERLRGKRLTKIFVNGKTKIVDFEIANKILNMVEE